MAKAIIRKRLKPQNKKSNEPSIFERLNRLTDSVPVARIRGKSFVLVKGDGGKKDEN